MVSLTFASSQPLIRPSLFAFVLPWAKPIHADKKMLPNDQEYFCLVSMLVLNHYRDVPRFMYWTMRIRKQLKNSPELVGYSLKAEPWKKRFWTLSAWSSKDAMEMFVHSGSHKDMLANMKGRMGNSRFTDWQTKDVPLKWSDAVQKLNELA
jgi:hypothetical protein